MQDLERLHAAAKVIAADGLDGIQSASTLVGRDIALGMLVMFLRRQRDPEGGWPEKEDTADQVNSMLMDAGLLDEIHFSPLSGHGVVYVNGEPEYVIDLANEQPLQPAAGTHLGMWMQGVGDITVIPAGIHPFTNALQVMRQFRDLAVQRLEIATDSPS